MRFVLLTLFVGVVATGCSSTIDPLLLNGTWVQDFDFPGNSFEMTLRSDGKIVTGSGDWCGEAGPCGTTTVTGTANGTAVELDLIYNVTMPAASTIAPNHFSGRLTSDDKLKGTINATGIPSPYSVGYHRR